MKLLFKGLVQLYQLAFSPIVGGECRFYPSCSEYFLRALAKERWDRALYIFLKRVLKCHPFHPGGIDLP